MGKKINGKVKVALITLIGVIILAGSNVLNSYITKKVQRNDIKKEVSNDIDDHSEWLREYGEKIEDLEKGYGSLDKRETVTEVKVLYIEKDIEEIKTDQKEMKDDMKVIGADVKDILKKL